MRLYKRNAILQSLTNGLSYQANNISAGAGYFAGAYPTQSTAIDSLSFATEAISVISGTLGTARSHMAGYSAPSTGYIAGGWRSAGYIASIDALNFATKATRVLAASLTKANSRPSPNVQSTLAGYVAGGDSGATESQIEKLDFTTEISTKLTAVLSYGRYYVSGFSSSVSGYVSGGPQGARMDKIDFATDTANQGPVSLLPESTAGGTGIHSNTKGYLCGMSNNRASAVSFATDTCVFTSSALTPTSQLTGGFQGSAKGYVANSSTTTSAVNSIAFSTETFALTTMSLNKAGFCSTGVSSN